MKHMGRLAFEHNGTEGTDIAFIAVNELGLRSLCEKSQPLIAFSTRSADALRSRFRRWRNSPEGRPPPLRWRYG